MSPFINRTSYVSLDAADEEAAEHRSSSTLLLFWNTSSSNKEGIPGLVVVTQEEVEADDSVYANAAKPSVKMRKLLTRLGLRKVNNNSNCTHNNLNNNKASSLSTGSVSSRSSKGLSSPSFATTEETDEEDEEMMHLRRGRVGREDEHEVLAGHHHLYHHHYHHRARKVRWSDQQQGGSIVTCVHDIPYVRPAFLRLVILLLHPVMRRFEFLHCELPEARLTVWDLLQQLPGLATEPTLQGVQFTALCRHRRSCRRNSKTGKTKRRRRRKHKGDTSSELEISSTGSEGSDTITSTASSDSSSLPSSRSSYYDSCDVEADEDPQQIELIHMLNIHQYELIEGEILLAVPDGYPPRTVIAHTEEMLKNRQLMRMLQRAKLSGRALRRLRPSKSCSPPNEHLLIKQEQPPQQENHQVPYLEANANSDVFHTEKLAVALDNVAPGMNKEVEQQEECQKHHEQQQQEQDKEEDREREMGQQEQGDEYYFHDTAAAADDDDEHHHNDDSYNSQVRTLFSKDSFDLIMSDVPSLEEEGDVTHPVIRSTIHHCDFDHEHSHRSYSSEPKMYAPNTDETDTEAFSPSATSSSARRGAVKECPSLVFSYDGASGMFPETSTMEETEDDAADDEDLMSSDEGQPKETRRRNRTLLRPCVVVEDIEDDDDEEDDDDDDEDVDDEADVDEDDDESHRERSSCGLNLSLRRSHDNKDTAHNAAASDDSVSSWDKWINKYFSCENRIPLSPHKTNGNY